MRELIDDYWYDREILGMGRMKSIIHTLEINLKYYLKIKVKHYFVLKNFKK